MHIIAYASTCIWTGDELAARAAARPSPGTHEASLRTIALQKWHGFIKSGDPAALWELLHPDVVFESPVVHTPQRGREISFKYLTSAAKVLGGPSFRYVGEWTNGTGAVLEFVTEVGGITINGVDIISFDADGLITHFKVMVRPLKAINLLHRLMGEHLANAP
jgi:SnoaL-like domain